MGTLQPSECILALVVYTCSWCCLAMGVPAPEHAAGEDDDDDER